MLFLMNNYFPSQTILKMHHSPEYAPTNSFLQNMLLPTSMPHVSLNPHDSTARDLPPSNVMPHESYSPNIIASHIKPHIQQSFAATNVGPTPEFVAQHVEIEPTIVSMSHAAAMENFSACCPYI
jgi:hypothetical protein